MRKLISTIRGLIFTFLLFPFPNAHAEYFFVYGPPTPVISIYDSSCGCGVRRHVHRRCHPVRHVRRPHCEYRPACGPAPRCGRRPACSSVTVYYACPSPRPCCGGPTPIEEPCGGSCGDCRSCNSGNWQIPDYEVYFAQPADYFEGEETPCYSCNPDLSTGDDDACAYPDMQINW